MAPELHPRSGVDGGVAPRRLDYYHEHGKVARRGRTPPDEERIRIIRETLPGDARSILDVGCGVGLVTRALAEDRPVVGIDLSRDVHRGAGEPRVCGLANALPFRDRSFDLVLATQIVEHLTSEDLAALIREMLRVTRRYLLITTTFHEDLRQASVRCPACGVLFNTYGHLRTFDEVSLAAAVPTARPVVTRTYLRSVPYPSILTRLNQGIFGAWPYDLALMCTHCGNESFPSGARGRARLARVSNLLARLLPRRPRPTRILMLFDQKGSTFDPREVR